MIALSIYGFPSSDGEAMAVAGLIYLILLGMFAFGVIIGRSDDKEPK